ncbi:DNA oxidative demethylase AlkB [Pseudomonas citri]|uniref:DNA oxidative demethylase AlkB n=1 Tax=Pseudomonas citri TaxID=2978349 RepID=UPI0036F3F281
MPNDHNPIILDLFADVMPTTPGEVKQIGEQAFVLRGFALPWLDRLLPALETVLHAAPFRHMVTPGGFTMSVALSSCGALGWTTDRSGYRYTAHDPQTGLPWPAMPAVFRELAQAAARQAHFENFEPDACLINRYVAGARMSLHQDKNERSLIAPIVSMSLGLPAMFQFGGFERSDKSQRIPLFHGDIVVWGGVDRMRYHGVLPLKPGQHPRLGAQRINLTFRCAG